MDELVDSGKWASILKDKQSNFEVFQKNALIVLHLMTEYGRIFSCTVSFNKADK